MSRLRVFFRKPRLADICALAGLLVYLTWLWIFVHNQYSVLDEGLYLYKGWLFVTGKYTPFQDFGVWMNQMPLSYLIPGWVELVFGPGLRTGRMFALFLGLVAGLGLWLTARRLGGGWPAAAVTWALALNPAAARMSALAASQGLVAALLAWTLFFALGRDRKNWQLLAGGLLAAVVVMVRINLILLLPLLALYAAWEHGDFSGREAAWHKRLRLSAPVWWLLAGMLVLFIGLHLFYWPNILRVWAKWLPFSFLSPWLPPKTIPTWNPDNPLGFRVASFFLAFRLHFTALVGALLAFIFWPARGRLKEWKSALFLALFLVSSFGLHAWAALGNEYCVFCFPTYTTFYSGAALLLAAVTSPGWDFSAAPWRKWLGGAGLLVVLGGIAFSAEGTVRDLLPDFFYKRLLMLPVPGLGGVQAWQVLANKFGLEYEALYDTAQAYFPVVAAVACGLLLLGAGRLFAARKNSAAWSLGAGFVAVLVLGSLLAPGVLFSGSYAAYDCAADVLPGYEAAGAQVVQVIPAGAKVFWAGYSPATLLYLPAIQILPGQLHGGYSFRISEEDDALLRYGWWNQALAEKWLAQSDVVLVEQGGLGPEDWLTGQLADFEQVARTAPQSCRPGSELLVFRRK